MKDAGWSVCKMAVETGRPSNTLAPMLKGRSQLSIELWFAIADFLDATLDFLFQRVGDDVPSIAVYDTKGRRIFVSRDEYSKMKRRIVIAHTGITWPYKTRYGSVYTLGEHRVMRLLIE